MDGVMSYIFNMKNMSSIKFCEKIPEICPIFFKSYFFYIENKKELIAKLTEAY